MDHNRVATLLHIAEKTLHWPSLRELHEAALVELKDHAEDAKEDRLEKEKPKPEPESQPKVGMGQGYIPRRKIDELAKEDRIETKLQADEDLHHAAEEKENGPRHLT